MAYAFNAQHTFRNIDGVVYDVITITETDVSVGSEWVVPVGDLHTISGVDCRLVNADLATTVNPFLGLATGAAEQLGITANVSAANPVVIVGREIVIAAAGVLYGRSRVNAHANEVKTVLILAQGQT